MYVHSALTTADLQRGSASVGDGRATAAGLSTAEGSPGFWAAPARKGNGLIPKSKMLGFPGKPADPREHKLKCLQAEV